MSLFCKKYSVCSECKVHFEPPTGHEAQWGHLCAAHRKPVRERDERRWAVINWATTNWEKLEPQMQEEIKHFADLHSAALQAQLGAMTGQQRQDSALGSMFGSGIRGLADPINRARDKS